jgi:hypothetical protein
MCWRCAGAPHERRRPVGLAKLCELGTRLPQQPISLAPNARDRAPAIVRRPGQVPKKSPDFLDKPSGQTKGAQKVSRLFG